MPKGVGHVSEHDDLLLGLQVRATVMPKGVGHLSSRRVAVTSATKCELL